MYPLRMAAGVLVVATVLLHSSNTVAVGVSGDGSDHDTGIHSGGQTARTELPQSDQEGTHTMSQLKASMDSMIDHLHQVQEQLIKQHSMGSEVLAQAKNVSLQLAQIIDELQRKGTLEASKGALIRIKLESEDMKQDIADLFREYNHILHQYNSPPKNFKTRPPEIIELIKERANKFQRVLEAEMDTVSNAVDELRAKEKQASHRYELTKEALNKLKSEFEQFRQYLIDQFKQPPESPKRYEFSGKINPRTEQFVAVVKKQLATALDNIAY